MNLRIVKNAWRQYDSYDCRTFKEMDIVLVLEVTSATVISIHNSQIVWTSISTFYESTNPI